MTIKDVEIEAFRLIRKNVRDIVSEADNNEIAGYVKGIVDIESEIYRILQKEGIDSGHY